MPKEIEINLRIRQGLDTPEGDLIQFLKEYRLSSSIKEHIWDLVKIHWLAIACAHSGKYQGWEIQQMGLESIALLNKQIVFLCSQLNLPSSISTPLPSHLEERFNVLEGDNLNSTEVSTQDLDPRKTQKNLRDEDQFVDSDFIDDDFA